MRIRAAVFDIYNTLLEVSAPPGDAERQWVELWQETFGSEPRLRLIEFAAACESFVARKHAAARAVGIPFPEVYWPDVLGEVLPEYQRLHGDLRRTFMRRHARLTHAVRIFPEAARVLRQLNERSVLLGLASNSQPYTLPELEAELAPSGMSVGMFHPTLRFLSFEHGFSKPDPHVFRFFSARLRTLDINVEETVVVGDRYNNDIEPAAAQGFQTWQLSTEPAKSENSGNWKQLGEFLSNS